MMAQMHYGHRVTSQTFSDMKQVWDLLDIFIRHVIAGIEPTPKLSCDPPPHPNILNTLKVL